MVEVKEKISEGTRTYRFVAKEDRGNVDRQVALARTAVEDIQDSFANLYGMHNLVTPTYDFATLGSICDQSDIICECIDAYKENIDGFGYQLQYRGLDQSTRTEKELKDKEKLENFFDYANDTQSWVTIRKEMRRDLERLGNAAIELIRNKNGEPMLVYNIPFVTLRAARLDTTPVTVAIQLMRDGKLINIPVQKFFRRYAQVQEGLPIRWFKSWGDPRILDSRTGEFVNNPPEYAASEIMHFKINSGGNVYGVPRWLSACPDALGRRKAQYVNMDLLDNQGIPPVIVLVSGGRLTQASYDELRDILRGMRGIENWNKVAVLESISEGMGLDDKSTAKIELKNLTEYRKDDLMFDNYLTKTEKSLRHTYRLTRMYTGSSEDFSHATSVVARISAEEQVFAPERDNSDENINMQIIQKEFKITKWWYKTKGPKIVGSKELALGVDAFSKIGAFTINHAIGMANESFGLQMSTFKEAWADYPIPLVLKLIEFGRLKDIEKIANPSSNDSLDTPDVSIKQPSSDDVLEKVDSNIAQMVEITEKVVDSNMFTEEEKDLYKRLLMIQYAIKSKE
jgi:PBSX family phage portal protein